MNCKAGQVLSTILLVFWLQNCQSHSTRPDPADEREQEALTKFYGRLNVGSKRQEIEDWLGGRMLSCEGNAPGPQRCITKFRVKAGEDLGAAQLGISIQNATVRDDVKSVVLDFRNQKLLRWELRHESERR